MSIVNCWENRAVGFETKYEYSSRKVIASSIFWDFFLPVHFPMQGTKLTMTYYDGNVQLKTFCSCGLCRSYEAGEFDRKWVRISMKVAVFVFFCIPIFDGHEQPDVTILETFYELKVVDITLSAEAFVGDAVVSSSNRKSSWIPLETSTY